MGTQYVDDHRFLLCKGSTVTDITRAVSQPEARDELDALSVELTFTAVRNNNRDKYMHWYGIEPGDKLRVVNHGREVFSGVILTVGLDGTVTANDMGWYLTKSEIILQLADAAAPDAVRRMCAKAGIAAGTIDLPPTRISQVWVGSTPEQILEDILAICSAETGLTYRRRVREGALQVGPLPTVPIIAYHKPAENLGAFDITLAKGSVSGSDSMAELTNSVVLAAGGESAETLGRAYNSASIAKYGLLQAVETLSGDENTAQARQRLQTLLAQGDRIARERSVDEIWGADEVESGILLQFRQNSYGVTGVQRVTGVTHRYGHPHLMSLTVEDPNPPGPPAAGTPLPFEEDSMGAWDYELARELRGLGRGAGRTEILEGTVVSVSPLTVSLFGGKVMAPPAPLQTLFCAQGFYRDADSGHLELESWKSGDRVCCCWMGKTVVVLGRLSEPDEALDVR